MVSGRQGDHSRDQHAQFDAHHAMGSMRTAGFALFQFFSTLIGEMDALVTKHACPYCYHHTIVNFMRVIMPRSAG